MFGHDGRENAAADVELRAQAHESRPRGSRQFVEHAVGDGLVERALVAVGPDVEFEVFQFQALALRDVVQHQVRKIRLAGQGAKAGKFRNLHMDQVVAAGTGIVEGTQFIAGFGGHAGLGKQK